jgi:hypothetical protein
MAAASRARAAITPAACWTLIERAGNLGGPSEDGGSHGFHMMDDHGLYQDSELPRSSSTAAAVVSVHSRPEE